MPEPAGIDSRVCGGRETPLVSSIIGSHQTSKAVGSLTDATGAAIQEGNSTTGQAQTGVLNAGTEANAQLEQARAKQQQQLDPYLTLGSTAANNYAGAIAPGGDLTKQFSFDPTQVANNPNYQFQMNEGIDAVKRAAAATGTLGSSQTLKGVANYAGGLASTGIAQDYSQALQTFNTNRNNTLSNYTLPLGLGRDAVAQSNSELGQYGQQYGQNLIGTAQYAGSAGMQNAKSIQQLLLDQGQAKATGSIQQGNIWGGFANSAGANTFGALSRVAGIG